MLDELINMHTKGKKSTINPAAMKLSSQSDTCVHCGISVVDEDGWAIRGSRGIVGVYYGEIIHYSICPNCLRR